MILLIIYVIHLNLLELISSTTIQWANYPLMMADNEFFPKIKQLAENTDAAPEAKAHDNPPYQEIESLCMHCNEQVRIYSTSSTKYKHAFANGNDRVSHE